MITVDVAIVGAGPAGIAAATEAARAAASVLVMDEYTQLGGQYYRQPAPGLVPADDATLFGQARDGARRIEEAVEAGARFVTNTLIWGGFKDGSLALHSAGRPEILQSRKLILACGAHERPVAFPGWTLPGVITAGAAQALLKGQGVFPGRRILMAGTGPLQIAVAAQLVQAGANVVGVLEAARIGSLLSSGPRFWRRWDRLGEGIQYWRILRSAKVPLLTGRTVVRALGDSYLSGVMTTKIDDDWSPVPGTESRIEADTLCLGFGLVPSTKLAALLGCQLAYERSLGGHVPVHDHCMQTTRPGVFVAGEAAGIGGAKVAELEGRIAGITAAQQLGKGHPKEASKRIEACQRELTQELRFARSLNETFAVRPGLLNLLTDDTIICRCQEITAGQIRSDRAAWQSNLDALKIVKRVGMGNCQGTTCETIVAQLLAKETGKTMADIGTYHIRSPLKPIPLGAMVALNEILLQTLESPDAH